MTVPNFSVGDDAAVLASLSGAFESVPAVRLLAAEMDGDHNRAVLTAAGPPEAVAEAAYRGAEVAVELIDLNSHKGVHPRIGAVDVIPFVPYRGVPVERLVELAAELGGRLAGELSLPVYLYGRAARSPDRENLSFIRNIGFEKLKEKAARDPLFRPDMGPDRLHPTAGAVAVGVRDPLIAFNVVLDSADLGLARRIAAEIRETSGGLPGVKALGLKLARRGKVQVSMNLTAPERAGLLEAFQAVSQRATRAGVEVLDTEIVGLVPLQAVLDAVSAGLKLTGFSSRKILEVHLD